MQKFWDSAMTLSPNEEDEETRRLYCFGIMAMIEFIFFT